MSPLLSHTVSCLASFVELLHDGLCNSGCASAESTFRLRAGLRARTSSLLRRLLLAPSATFAAPRPAALISTSGLSLGLALLLPRRAARVFRMSSSCVRRPFVLRLAEAGAILSRGLRQLPALLLPAALALPPGLRYLLGLLLSDTGATPRRLLILLLPRRAASSAQGLREVALLLAIGDVLRAGSAELLLVLRFAALCVLQVSPMPSVLQVSPMPGGGLDGSGRRRRGGDLAVLRNHASVGNAPVFWAADVCAMPFHGSAAADVHPVGPTAVVPASVATLELLGTGRGSHMVPGGAVQVDTFVSSFQ